MKFETFINEAVATARSSANSFTPESGIGQFLFDKKGIAKAVIDFLTHDEYDISFGKGDIYFVLGNVDDNNNLNVECKVVGKDDDEFRIFTFDLVVNVNNEVTDVEHDDGELSFKTSEEAHKKAATFGVKF